MSLFKKLFNTGLSLKKDAINQTNEPIENSREDFEKIVMDYCYDRFICKCAGAKYSRMNKDDVQKIREYIQHEKIYQM